MNLRSGMLTLLLFVGYLESTSAQQFFRPGDVLRGQYRCAQGETSAVLRVQEVQNFPAGTSVSKPVVLGVFEFGSQLTPRGSYRVIGHFDGKQNLTNFEPTDWILRPGRYEAVGFTLASSTDNDQFSGNVAFRNCGAIILRREGTSNESTGSSQEKLTRVSGERDVNRLDNGIGVANKDTASVVHAFGFQLGAKLVLPACPPGGLNDFPRVCAVPADADAAHPTRVLEFERMTISAPHFPAQPGVPSDGLVMIMFPKRVRPDFLSDRRAGLFAVVANGRLEGVLGWVWPNFPMISYFTEQYGKPTVARVGNRSEERLVYSFKTSSGMAKIGCDPTGQNCDVAQVLTDSALPLLERAMRNLRSPSNNSSKKINSTADDPALRAMREHTQQQSAAMAEQMQRDAARARQQEAEESERVRRQNDQIRRQQESYEEEERRRRNNPN